MRECKSAVAVQGKESYDLRVCLFGNIIENKTAIINAKMKLVSLSEMPVLSSKNIFQIMVPAVPEIRDANTPALLNFFQNEVSNENGQHAIPPSAYL
jgi:hypothetical protein